MFVSHFLSSTTRLSIKRSFQRSFSSAPAVNPFHYQELFDLSHDDTPYRKVSDKHVQVVEVRRVEGDFLVIMLGKWNEILKSRS